MRKLFSALAVVLVFAMAFTITASAAITGDKVYEPVGGKYTITEQDDSIKGVMVGLVVVESVDVEEDEFTENNIKYIDQVKADAEGNITSPAFKPMAKSDANNYLVYIGGGTLSKATKLGKLSVPIAPESVTVDLTSATLIVDDPAAGSVTLAETVLPAGATYTAEWTSSVPTVATVENGVVTAVGAGDTVITVKVADGITATCNIHVDLPVANGIAISQSTLNLAVEATKTLTASLTPNKAEKLPNGETPVYKWSSDNTDVATVDETTGLVTAVAEGNANITVKVVGYEEEANYTKTCAVTVTEKSTVVYGDVNIDSKVNVKDANALARYVAEWSANNPLGDGIDYVNAFTNGTFSKDNADVNVDGKVNAKDANAMARYVAEWSANNPLGDGIDYTTLPIASN